MTVGLYPWPRLEADHALHALDEIASLTHHPQLDADAFVDGGRQALDAVATFWNGLVRDRSL